jgi:sporulation protein YqfC
LLVENHRCLVEYNPGRMTLGIPGGELTIEGEELSIGSISPEEITLTGKVTCLRFGTEDS